MQWKTMRERTGASIVFSIGTAVSIVTAAPAMDADSRAAWGASALAVAEFHREPKNRCKWWEVDEAAVRRVIAWSGRSEADLRASEDYAEQRQALTWSDDYIRKQYADNSMSCDASGSVFGVDEHTYGVMRSR